MVVIQTTDGTVWTWGDNSSGQLGTGGGSSLVPVQVFGLSGITAVAAGSYHTLALKSDGTVWAWGKNLNGQVGTGSASTAEVVPVQVAGVSGITAIAAGSYHSVAYKSDGTVYTWGSNANGQLGDGGTTDHCSPASVTGLGTVIGIAAGGNHTLVILSGGAMKAFGLNTWGQLGDGTTAQRPNAVDVSSVPTATAATAGADFTLIRRTDNTASAWGHNDSSEIGDGTTTTPRLTPVAVSGLTSLSAVAASPADNARHAYALESDGTVWAWGLNDQGQLGDGTNTPRRSPVQITTLSSVAGIGAGTDFGAAVTTDGTVWTWGNNSVGQLGDGTTARRSTPVAISGPGFSWKVGTPTFSPAPQTYGTTQTVTISCATSGATIYYTTDGSTPTTASRVYSTAISVTQSTTIKALSAKAGFTNSTIGVGPYTLQVNGPSFTQAPATFTSPTNVAISSTSPGVSLYYTTDGTTPTTSSTPYMGPVNIAHTTTLKAFGARSGWTSGRATGVYTMNFGTLAAPTMDKATGTYSDSVRVRLSAVLYATIYYTTDGTAPTTSSLVYTAPLVLGTTTAVKAIAYHPDYTTSAVATNTYTIKVADPVLSRASRKRAVETLVTTYGPGGIAGGGSHSVLVKPDGTVWTFGVNSTGQLGDGTATQRLLPVQVSGITNGTAVAAGSAFTLVLKADGTVWSFGDNTNGQLGDGTTTQRMLPVQVASLTNVTAIAAGAFHALALKADGSVWAWGYNQFGQVGDGTTTTPRTTPVQVAGLGPVLAIAAGYAHSAALLGDGTVATWGSNSNGQLGNSTQVNRSVPGLADGMTAIHAISAGSNSTFAVRDDATMWSWGFNTSGELGDGTVSTRTLPVPIPGLSAGQALAAACPLGQGGHVLMIKTDGTVSGWGGNSNGQVGDGTTIDQHSPVPVSGLSSVVAVATGQSHSLAITSDGSVWAWGRNGNGQVGDGTSVDRSLPVKVTEAGFLSKVGAPTVTPAPGTYNVAQSVTLGTATSGAAIYYTLNGTTPTSSSTPYTGAISISQTTTLKAIAIKAGLSDSNVVTAVYTLQVVMPAFTPVPATYTSTQNVAMSTTTSGAEIRYTNDGSTPTQSSTLYTAPVAVTTTVTLKAAAFKTGWAGSQVKSGVYTLNLGTLAAPTINPSSGTFAGSVSVTLSAVSGASIYYTTNGTTPTTSSTLYTGAFTLTQTSTVKAIAVKPDFTTSTVASATLNVKAVAPALSLSAGTYAAGQQVTVTDTDATVTIRYTITGVDPVATDPVIVSGTVLTLEKGFTLKAAGFKTGCLTSDIVSAAYTVTGALTGGRVAAGENHSIAVPTDATVWTWGDDTNGQLGNGTSTTTPQTVPLQVPGVGSIQASAGGLSHTLVLDTSGNVWAFGLNTNGQLGDGTTTQRTSPVQVLTGVIAIAAGDKHSLAIKTNGSVWAWGLNTNGQIGDGTTVQKNSPTAVSLTGTYIAVAGGGSHSLALKSDGSVYAWGLNGNGQLGDATTTQRPSPVPITVGGSVAAVAAGTSHSVALLSDGTVKAWGLNSSGQVGDGTLVQKTSPTASTGLVGIVGVAAGNNYSLAIGPDGTVRAWGSNTAGQLGDGTTTNRSTAVVSSAPSGIVSVAGGAAHSLAVKSDGSVWAWGDNLKGQVGDGTQTQRRTAVQVSGVGFSWTVGTPVLTPATGSYSAPQSVVVKCDTPAATIRYTTNGVDPTTSDPTVVSGGTVSVSQSLTLKAKAWKGTSPPSAVAAETYTLTVPTPTVDVATGSYGVPKTVTLSAQFGATIYYTTDGTTWAVYSAPLAINRTTTVQAYGVLSGWTQSAIGSWTYTLVAADPALSPTGGLFGTAQTVTVTDTTPGVDIHYTLNGVEPGPVDPTVASGGTVVVSSSAVLKAKAFRTGWTASGTTKGTFMITGAAAAAPTMSPAPGTYTAAQSVALATMTPGATIRYTTDGSDPNLSSGLYLAPLTVNTTTTIKAKAFLSGLTTSSASTGTYTINLGSVATPVLSPGPGRYASARNVVVTCATSGATIHYTTNGNDPTASDPVVASGASVLVNRSLPLKVKAMKTGLADSPVQRGDYLVVGAIASGVSHTLALKADGTIWAWGLNTSAQLGDNTTTNRPQPIQVATITDGRAIASGGAHSLAVRSDGTVWAWGTNASGQLGDNTTTQHKTPFQALNVTNAVAVAAGGTHSLALTSSGAVWAWGNNQFGQLGDGTTTTRKAPFQVAGLTNVVGIAAGDSHSIAVKSDGTVLAWGLNTNGQIGDGTTVNRWSPVPVPLTGAVAVAAKLNNSLVLRTDGASLGMAWAWGSNGNGQLGNGTTSPNPNPVPTLVSGFGGFGTIAQGQDHTLALRLDALGGTTPLAWGSNYFGQIGDGAPTGGTVTRLRPIPVLSLGTILGLDAGSFFATALKADGTVWTWGNNSSGQLGHFATTGGTSNVPVQVTSLVLSDTTWLLSDPDQDGLLTVTELLLGTDPLSADTNGDGILDGAEVKAGRSATNIDPDGDGLSNLVERQLGTDPFNPDTDGDGTPDGQDCFPLDPTRWQCPGPVGGDTTPPVITLTEPTSAVLISSVP
jgi:alpha-tubulin suppressor-like RCC1 family protein